jgi:AraC-like DNA-binding protein
MAKRNLFYSGVLLFFIPVIIASIDSTHGIVHEKSTTNAEFSVFPNERCTTIVYNDEINCGSSAISLPDNTQRAIISRFKLTRSRVLDEPFLGIEILFKDTTEIHDISPYDFIDIDMVLLNEDTSGSNFMIQLKSRLSNPSNLPPPDTLKCGDPIKRPNRRHPFSIIHRQIGIEKFKFRYTLNIDSFFTPTWYGDGATLYRERFDKRRFYSVCIQTGSNAFLDKDFTVVITRIAFRKGIQGKVQLNSNARLHSNNITLFWLLSIAAGVLYVLLITFIIRKKNYILREESVWIEKIFAIINANLGNSTLSVNTIASEAGISPETIEHTIRLEKCMYTSDYLHLLRLEKEAEYLFEKNHRHQIEWEITNNREFDSKNDNSTLGNSKQANEGSPEPVTYDERTQKVILYFRENYKDLKLDEQSDDEKKGDENIVDSKIAKSIELPLDEIKNILDDCFGSSNKKYPICHHLKVIRIEVAKKIMNFYIERRKETYALKWLYSKVGFKEQDRLTKAWKETLNILDETPNKFQERVLKSRNSSTMIECKRDERSW